MSNTLSLDASEAIKNFCEEHGYDLRLNYSGRGMYGRECFGLVVPDSGIEACMLLAVYLSQEVGDISVENLASNVRTDSMGRDLIVYFPNYKLHDGDEEEEEEDENS